MAVQRGNVHVPPKDLRRLELPGVCRFCGDPTWMADDDGPLHPCCEMWAAVLAAGKPCPACAQSRSATREWRERQAINRKRRR